VRDPAQSALWYREVFGLETLSEYAGDDGVVGHVCIGDRGNGVLLCFVHHAESSGDAFSEFHTGLDHVEFFVPARTDLDEWVSTLDSLGVEHSGVKAPAGSKNAMLTFRDPDNIQLELFFDGLWQATAPGGRGAEVDT
jgi:catechol 2,3-dioxygenase-like lactoylglutathione lyase family enzyme